MFVIVLLLLLLLLLLIIIIIMMMNIQPSAFSLQPQPTQFLEMLLYITTRSVSTTFRVFPQIRRETKTKYELCTVNDEFGHHTCQVSGGLYVSCNNINTIVTCKLDYPTRTLHRLIFVSSETET